MASTILVLATNDQVLLTQVSLEASWRSIREVKIIIGLAQREKLCHQAHHVQQHQQCQQQRSRLQRQRATLQSQRTRCTHPGNSLTDEPAASADACSTCPLSP